MTKNVAFESVFLTPNPNAKTWVAVLRPNPDGTLSREFVNTKKEFRNFGDGTRYKIKFNGVYPVGTVFEISQASSQQNHWYGRNYFIVTPQGMHSFGNIKDPKAEQAVAKAFGVKQVAFKY